MHLEPSIRDAALGKLDEGTVTGVLPARRVELQSRSGETVSSRCLHGIDLAWLAAALEIGPVDALCVATPSGHVVVGLIPGAEHDSVKADLSLDCESVTIRGSSFVRIASGKSMISLSNDGKVEVRGRDVLSRASEVNRATGGRVKVN
jgi:hypothetical protein